MAIFRSNISLHNFPYYSSTAVLEGELYIVELYFHERTQSWAINLLSGDSTPIVMGQRLSPEYPLFLDYTIQGLSGYFYLEPKGRNKNETINNPYEIWKYYNLYYYWEEEEE